MQNVIRFPGPHTNAPPPSTPDGWKKTIAVAAERTVLAEMKGDDPAPYRQEFERLLQSAPQGVREELSGAVKVEDLFDTARKGLSFLQSVWELWKKI